MTSGFWSERSDRGVTDILHGAKIHSDIYTLIFRVQERKQWSRQWSRQRSCRKRSCRNGVAEAETHTHPKDEAHTHVQMISR